MSGIIAQAEAGLRVDDLEEIGHLGTLVQEGVDGGRKECGLPRYSLGGRLEM